MRVTRSQSQDGHGNIGRNNQVIRPLRDPKRGALERDESHIRGIQREGQIQHPQSESILGEVGIAPHHRPTRDGSRKNQSRDGLPRVIRQREMDTFARTVDQQTSTLGHPAGRCRMQRLERTQPGCRGRRRKQDLSLQREQE